MKPTTTNYGLIKPTDDDFYDIQDHNQNMDTIDTELKKSADGLAAQFQQIRNCLEEIEASKKHGHSVATTTTDGFMSKTDKGKLDGVEVGANKYVHPGSGTNPHGTSKADVGLGSVQNYGIATTTEAQAGISTTKYMTPALTKVAIEELSGVTKAYMPTSTSRVVLSNGVNITTNGQEIKLGNFIPKYTGYVRLKIASATGHTYGSTIVGKDTGWNIAMTSPAGKGRTYSPNSDLQDSYEYNTHTQNVFNSIASVLLNAPAGSVVPSTNRVGEFGDLLRFLGGSTTPFYVDLYVTAGVPIGFMVSPPGVSSSGTVQLTLGKVEICYDEVAV